MNVVKEEPKEGIKMNLSPEEHAKLKELNAKFMRAQNDLAQSVIRQHEILKFIDKLSAESEEFEKQLAEVYGKGALINAQTGEVTVKPQENVAN